jgi:formylglycine-generating enzyme required for sulfatase activity
MDQKFDVQFVCGALALFSLLVILPCLGCGGDDDPETGNVDLSGNVPIDTITGKDGAEMVRIPAGEFEMGDHFDEVHDDDVPPHAVFLDNFYIDRYEVTNGQYAVFLNAMGRHKANGHVWLDIDGDDSQIELALLFSTESDFQGNLDDEKISTDLRRGFENNGITLSQNVDVSIEREGNHWLIVDHDNEQEYSVKEVEDELDIYGLPYQPKADVENYPAVGVSWYGAAAYAQWSEKRLPTEVEWEKAARGRLAGKQYPWGDKITHDNANYSGAKGHDEWDGSAPTGSFPPNGYGIYDMAGNVFEWCMDEYDSNFYETSPKNNPISGKEISFVDNDFAEIETRRVCRGGGWDSHSYRLRVATRNGFDPDSTNKGVGFRCVVSMNP